MGIGINSFGIALITKSALGTSQISSVPYVMSLKWSSLSFGVWTFLFNMLFILLQILLLKKEFKPIQFLQIPANIIFSYLLDVSMLALQGFQPNVLPLRFVSLLVGCFVLALGIAVEVAPNTVTVPGEGIVRALSVVVKRSFGTVKVYFDVTLIVIAVILSFLFFGSLQGVGIGTVVSAVTVGRFVNLINAHVPLRRFIPDAAEES